MTSRTGTKPEDRAGAYVGQYRAMTGDLNRNDPSWLREIRGAACSRFEETGFPSTDLEDWRFTPLGELPRTVFQPARAAAIDSAVADADALPELGVPRIVLLEGRYAPGLSNLESLPRSLVIGGIASALRWSMETLAPSLARVGAFENNPLAALNTFLFTDGALIAVPERMVCETPIHVVHAATRSHSDVHSRLLVRAGESSSVRVIEHFVSLGAEEYWTNSVAEFDLGAGASVELVRLQDDRTDAWHTGMTAARLGRDSNFKALSMTCGARLSRHDVTALLDGSGAEATLNGLYLVDGERLADSHTMIDHARPHCPSHELYKGILGGSARGVFNGKIFVRQDAQKTDAKQTNQALLLSNDAQVHTKPQLEIFADDVKCTHGATIGQLDADALFYLRARGIGDAQAKAMLIRAFAEEVLERTGVEEAREMLEARLDRALASMIGTA